MEERQMPIHEPMVMADNDRVHCTVNRANETTLHSVWRDPATEEVVLDITVLDYGNITRINNIKHSFWTFSVDGSPVAHTDSVFNDLTQLAGPTVKNQERELAFTRRRHPQA